LADSFNPFSQNNVFYRFASHHPLAGAVVAGTTGAAAATAAAAACIFGGCEVAAGVGTSLLGWLSSLAGPAESDVQALSSEEQQTYEDVCSNPNNLGHVFAEKHNFGSLINEFGSEQNVLKQIIYSMRGSSLPQSGTYNVVVQVGGNSVNVNGAVVNGIPRISTAWIQK